MNIAMFTDYFFPELGGIQDSVATIARALGQRGHRIAIYAPRYGRRDYRRVAAAQAEPALGPNVRVTRRLSLPFPSSTRQSRAALASPISWMSLGSNGGPDLIHAHSFFGIGLEALLCGARLGVPVIGTNHTTVAGFGPHMPIRVDWAMAYARWFFNRCDHVTAPSHAVFEELGGMLHSPRDVVSNPIDTDLFTPASPTERVKLRAAFGLSRPTIAYAGRLGPEKNIDVLLRAMAALSQDAELVIAGHGSLDAILRRMAVELGIAARVRFLGTLPQAELARLLRAADVFAIMSTSETQSMVLLQAMASGLPVIAAASRALPEFVDPENGILIEAGDHAALAAALDALLAAPHRRVDLGVAGRTRAETFNIQAVTSRWETLYRSVQIRRSASAFA